MTKLSFNVQKENLSTIKFKLMIHPWVATKLDADTGIDFSVQPYNEKNRAEDNSLESFPKTFDVQLKSTSEEIKTTELNQGKLDIDVKHLLSWKERQTPLMIIRYYFEHDAFFYTWIDEIDIKSQQKTQVITLPYKVEKAENDISSKIYQEQFKENVLDKILPPNVHELIYEPINAQSGMGYLKIDNIRSGHQIENLFKSGLLQTMEEKMKIHQKINHLNDDIFRNGLKIQNGMEIAIYYLKLDDISHALSSLNYLSNTLQSIEAKIIKNIITENKYDLSLIKQASTIDFQYYISFKTPLSKDVSLTIVLDEKAFLFKYSEQNIYKLPKMNFNKVTFKFDYLMTEDKTWTGKGKVFVSSTITTKQKFTFYRGIIINGELHTKFSEALISDELRISSISTN